MSAPAWSTVVAQLTDGSDAGAAVVAGETTGWEWVAAGAVLAGAIALGFAARSVLRRVAALGEASHATEVVGRLVQWLIVLVGFVLALGILDVRITPLLGALGIGGIAVALALQSTMENVFAGVVLHAQRPLRIGEEVETGDVSGRIIDITARAVVLQSFEGERVFIPNKVVLEREIHNRVRHGRRRTTVRVGVAYETDLHVATEVLTAAAYSVDGVLDTPAPRVFASGFGDSSIDFEIDVWHKPNELIKRQVRHRVVLAVHEMLAAADIVIPFPQRTLWMGGDERHAPDLVSMASNVRLGRLDPTEAAATVDDELTAEDLADHDPTAADVRGAEDEADGDAGPTEPPGAAPPI